MPPHRRSIAFNVRSMADGLFPIRAMSTGFPTSRDPAKERGSPAPEGGECLLRPRRAVDWRVGFPGNDPPKKAFNPVAGALMNEPIDIVPLAISDLGLRDQAP